MNLNSSCVLKNENFKKRKIKENENLKKRKI
jgi:hypothetical protein